MNPSPPIKKIRILFPHLPGSFIAFGIGKVWILPCCPPVKFFPVSQGIFHHLPLPRRDKIGSLF